MFRTSLGKNIDELLANFSRDDIWRLMADAWQHSLGPEIFRSEYYLGLKEGFKCLDKFFNCTEITPEILEELHQSFYQHESDGKKDHGFRNNSRGSFDIEFKTLINERTADVSPDGLDEFSEGMIAATTHKTKLPIWGIQLVNFTDIDKNAIIDPMSPIFLDEQKQLNKEKLNRFLLKAFKATTSDILQGKEIQRQVYITNLNLPRDKLLEIISGYLKTFHSEMNNIKSHGMEDQKLGAIASLIQKLHRLHCFMDGNCRTFIFLLKNLLLMKHLNTLSFTSTPAHFTGFSLKELVAEMKNDITLFQEFKVTAAKEFLSSLELKDFSNPKNIGENLKNYLSKVSPSIALAQINELYHQINENNLKVPKGFKTKKGFWGSSAKVHEAHRRMLIILKDLYYEKIREQIRMMAIPQPKEEKTSAPSFIPKHYDRMIDQASFNSIVSRHFIVNDERILTSDGKQLKALVQFELSTCSYPKLKDDDLDYIEAQQEFGKLAKTPSQRSS